MKVNSDNQRCKQTVFNYRLETEVMGRSKLHRDSKWFCLLGGYALAVLALYIRDYEVYFEREANVLWDSYRTSPL